jgi:hypothetical protein
MMMAIWQRFPPKMTSVGSLSQILVEVLDAGFAVFKGYPAVAGSRPAGLISLSLLSYRLERRNSPSQFFYFWLCRDLTIHFCRLFPAIFIDFPEQWAFMIMITVHVDFLQVPCSIVGFVFHGEDSEPVRSRKRWIGAEEAAKCRA